MNDLQGDIESIATTPGCGYKDSDQNRVDVLCSQEKEDGSEPREPECGANDIDEGFLPEGVRCAGSSGCLNLSSRKELRNTITSDPESVNSPKTSIVIENEPEHNGKDSETTFDVRVNTRPGIDEILDQNQANNTAHECVNSAAKNNSVPSRSGMKDPQSDMVRPKRIRKKTSRYA